jgi:predicted NUDIX family NTP pyrophosphohydrolase
MRIAAASKRSAGLLLYRRTAGRFCSVIQEARSGATKTWALLKSNVFEMEWPLKSGRKQPFPELDRAGWFGIAEARTKILKGQAVFMDRLEAMLAYS